MNIAIIPWAEIFMADKMFDIADRQINHDHRMEQFYRMKREFERNNDRIHTIDMYGNLHEVDYFLFFEWNLSWIDRLADMGLSNRTIYCNAEPPTVNPLNSREGFKKISRYFPYIMTWNDELVDEKTIFKRNIPYHFKIRIGDVPFAHRKLLVCISGNKHSRHPDELYSERERVIYFAEGYCPDDFDLYGGGWDKKKHPSYCGRVEEKAEIYKRYRFALSFENMKNVKGYISEKIMDCLCSGIVPIYAGSDNIGEYVPEACFIRYDSFEDPREMVDFLLRMSEETYKGYLDAARLFLISEMTDRFSGEEYARNIYHLIRHAEKLDFQINRQDRLGIKMLLKWTEAKKLVKKLVKV